MRVASCGFTRARNRHKHNEMSLVRVVRIGKPEQGTRTPTARPFLHTSHSVCMYRDKDERMSSSEFTIISRAADGRWSLLCRRSTAVRLVATQDPADALTWGSLADLQAWVEAQGLGTWDSLRERNVEAIEIATGQTTAITIPAPNFDRVWSPTLDPIYPEMCRGRGRVYAPEKPAKQVAKKKAPRLAGVGSED